MSAVEMVGARTIKPTPPQGGGTPRTPGACADERGGRTASPDSGQLLEAKLMGRHTKLKASTRTAPIVDEKDAFGQLDGMYSRVIAGVDKLLGSIETTIDAGTASPALAREAANLVRALNGISAEQRAREKQRRAALKAIDVDVMNWFRGLGARERAVFIRQLEDIDGDTKRSGLA